MDTGKLQSKDSFGIQSSDSACPKQAPQDATCLADKKAKEKAEEAAERDNPLSNTINAACKGFLGFLCPSRDGEEEGPQ